MVAALTRLSLVLLLIHTLTIRHIEMPRRPALGTIAINSFYNSQNNGNNKQASSAAAAASLKTSIRTTTTLSSGDENAVAKSNKQPFDYDIYTDESTSNTETKSGRGVHFADEVEDVELRSESSSSSSMKENQKEFNLVSVIDSEDDDDDTCNDQDEFESDDEVSEFDEDEEATTSSSSAEIQSDDDDDEDQIVRLDCSVNLTMSPMACDDTIKLLSRLDEEGEQEEVEEDEKENRVIDEYERKMRQAENVLFNLIDYRDDCMEYMRHLELELRPDPGYMRKQVDISSDMRAILVDWLVDVINTSFSLLIYFKIWNFKGH